MLSKCPGHGKILLKFLEMSLFLMGTGVFRSRKVVPVLRSAAIGKKSEISDMTLECLKVVKTGLKGFEPLADGLRVRRSS